MKAGCQLANLGATALQGEPDGRRPHTQCVCRGRGVNGKLIVKFGYRGERLIEPSSKRFPNQLLEIVGRAGAVRAASGALCLLVEAPPQGQVVPGKVTWYEESPKVGPERGGRPTPATDNPV